MSAARAVVAAAVGPYKDFRRFDSKFACARSAQKFSKICLRSNNARGRKVTTAEADHCQTMTAIGSAGTAAGAPDRLQWVRNGLTLTADDDYFSKVLSDPGHRATRVGAGQRAGYTKTDLGLQLSSHLNHPQYPGESQS